MSSQEMVRHRENAEIYHGDAIFKVKSRELLEKFALPKGLLPLSDVVEVGYNESTGFVWLKQNKKKEHKFRRIGRSVTYDTQVTGFIEDRRMRKVTGVKSKEFLIWLTVSDMYIADPASGKITFATATGFSRTFPVSAFEVDDETEENV